MASAFEQHLETVLAREIEGFQTLLSCEQLSAGASQETYRITYASAGGEQRLALRRSQPTASSGSSVGGIDLATEAHLFQLAVEGAIPGPQIHYVLKPGDDLGDGFIMQWLEGETLGQRINRSEALAAVRPRLARECGEILGRLHALDIEGAGLKQVLPVVTPESLVRDTWERYRELDVPVPMIDYTWRWLLDHLPQDSRSCLVHGDFRNGNLMVTPEGINAVLDWELAHVGDPVRDLGWLCVNSWRFGNRTLAVGGFGEIDDLLAGYAASSGIDVSREALRFWQVFGSFWWAMATLQMAHAWRTGETPSLERPVIGRRSSEAQMDCVNLIIPGSVELPDGDRPLSKGTQMPMSAELLSGAREFLKREVAEKLDPMNGFLAKVAANSIGIAQRELQFGGTLARAEQERLSHLLGKDADLDSLRWELVEQLRDRMPLDGAELTNHLRQTVACQLFVDQPRYSALAPGE